MRLEHFNCGKGRIIIGIVHDTSETHCTVQVVNIINELPFDWELNDRIKLSKSLIIEKS